MIAICRTEELNALIRLSAIWLVCPLMKLLKFDKFYGFNLYRHTMYNFLGNSFENNLSEENQCAHFFWQSKWLMIQSFCTLLLEFQNPYSLPMPKVILLFWQSKGSCAHFLLEQFQHQEMICMSGFRPFFLFLHFKQKSV